jgi:hypothetical protein
MNLVKQQDEFIAHDEYHARGMARRSHDCHIGASPRDGRTF